MVKHVLSAIGLIPTDLLYCSKWELKIISNILNNFGLSFWSQLILNISLFAETLNLDRNYFMTNISDSTHYANKNFETNIIRNFSRKYSMHYLKNYPSILDPQWRNFIYTYPHKLLLLNSAFQFCNTSSNFLLSLSNEKQDLLKKIINEFGLLISKQITSTDLINIKAPFLFYNLLFHTNRGLTSKIYCGLVTELAKDHFSAPTKWNKIGFGYSTPVIQKAAGLIYQLKLPTRFKSKLFKHNLMGYKSLGLLKALGYLESTRCKFCTTSNMDYLHIFFDCPFSQFLLSIFEHQILKYLHTKVKITVDMINVFYIPTSLRKNIRDIMCNLIGSIKVNLHNLFFKTYAVCNPYDESKAISLYNKIINDCKILNPLMSQFNRLHYRPIKDSLYIFYNNAKVEPIIKHNSKFTNNYEDSFSKAVGLDLDKLLNSA